MGGSTRAGMKVQQGDVRVSFDPHNLSCKDTDTALLEAAVARAIQECARATNDLASENLCLVIAAQ